MSIPNSKTSNDQENSTHIKNKKRALATTFKKKNYKDVVDLINDEDDSVAEMYARYVK
jgi:hypothetical protein